MIANLLSKSKEAHPRLPIAVFVFVYLGLHPVAR